MLATRHCQCPQMSLLCEQRPIQAPDSDCSICSMNLPELTALKEVGPTAQPAPTTPQTYTGVMQWKLTYQCELLQYLAVLHKALSGEGHRRHHHEHTDVHARLLS
jgi:hypothetical protein